MPQIRRVVTGFAVLLVLAVARDEACAQCAKAPASAKAFVREHRVSHYNGNPPSRVRDELTLWSTASGAQCFFLRTVGPNYHECDVSGALSTNARKALEYQEGGGCTLAFEVTPDSVRLTTSLGWERTSAGGVCSQLHCGMYGGVKPGTFHSR